MSLLSFVATCAGIDWNLSGSEIASITSIVFAGELFGSMFWGPIADKYGRRVAFILGSLHFQSCVVFTCQYVGSAVIAVSGFLSGFSPNFTWLLIFRGLVGFGVGRR